MQKLIDHLALTGLHKLGLLKAIVLLVQKDTIVQKVHLPESPVPQVNIDLQEVHSQQFVKLEHIVMLFQGHIQETDNDWQDIIVLKELLRK